MRIDGSGALVAGGASGLGEATVRQLHAGGATVTVADVNDERGHALVAELGERANYAHADVTHEEEVAAAVAQAAQADGGLRINVCCAGTGWAQKIAGSRGPHDLLPFETIIRINLIGTFNVLRFSASAMIANEPLGDSGERGVNVNTASAAAYDGQIGQVAYSASKGGINSMTLVTARDLSSQGVRVNTIMPGLIDTPIYGTGEKADAFKAKLGESVLFPHRLGTPDELASIVVECITNDYMNGETIRCDGGIRMPPK